MAKRLCQRMLGDGTACEATATVRTWLDTCHKTAVYHCEDHHSYEGWVMKGPAPTVGNGEVERSPSGWDAPRA